MEKYIPDDDGGYDAYKIRDQSAGKRITCFFDIDGAEINGQDVKGCFGGALQDTGQAAHEGIGAIVLGQHQFRHDGPGAAAAEYFHDAHGQRRYKISIKAQPAEECADTVIDEVHAAGGAENGNA